MALYSIVSILVAVVMSCINITILSKYKILRKDSIFIVSLASIIISVTFPLILNGFITAGTSMSFGVILITSIITCLSLIIVTSAIVAYREYNKDKGKIPNWNMSNIVEGLKNISCLVRDVVGKNIRTNWHKQLASTIGVNNIKGEFVDTEENTDTIGIEGLDEDLLLFDSNLTDQESINDIDSFETNFEDYLDEEVLKESLNFENEYEADEHLDDHLFDSIYNQDENIDDDIDELIRQSDFPYLNSDIDIPWDELVASTREEEIGDNKAINSGANDIMQNKSLDEIIDEGFKLKKQGDYEGAIINFLYALDNRPADDVARLIVLDICVMYKQLGQVELAKKVLDSYIAEYGIVMDEALKYEIELNLQ